MSLLINTLYRGENKPIIDFYLWPAVYMGILINTHSDALHQPAKTLCFPYYSSSSIRITVSIIHKLFVADFKNTQSIVCTH